MAETLFKLKVLWNRTETQMEFLRTVWESLDPILQQNQQLLLSELETKLQKSVRLIDGVIENKQNAASHPNVLKMKGIVRTNSLPDVLKMKGTVRRVKFALSIRESLKLTVAEFIEWHQLFDPSWYLLSRVASKEVDRCLEAKDETKDSMIQALSVLRRAARDINARADRPSRDISSYDFLGTRMPITNSSAAIAQFEDSSKFAIVDHMSVHWCADKAGTNRDVKGLSKALLRMDPFMFGLLRCCGVINRSQKSGFGEILAYDLVFEIPKGLRPRPRSLRDLLRHTQPSLNMKLEMAKHLANSVFYLHTTGFVHKNIRPEIILIFEQEDSSATLLCLVGFEKFRMAQGATSLLGDGLLDRELYRHPFRQGYDPDMEYVMQHDIYSLGVCLLEISLWVSFIEEQTPDGGFSLHNELNVDGILAVTDQRKRAFGVKKRLVAIAEERLPLIVGQRLTDTVVSCLTCLDGLGSWDDSEYDGSKEINVGVKFIENVLARLHEIVV